MHKELSWGGFRLIMSAQTHTSFAGQFQYRLVEELTEAVQRLSTVYHHRCHRRRFVGRHKQCNNLLAQGGPLLLKLVKCRSE